jgi:hypothetical protein
MPYICDDCKDALLENPYDSGGSVGELTFKLTGTIACYLDMRLEEEGELFYSDLSEVLAALESAKADFIERVLMPYELKKRLENGDVWGENVINAVGGVYIG